MATPARPSMLLKAASRGAHLGNSARENEGLSPRPRFLIGPIDRRLERRRRALREGPGFDTILRAPASPPNAGPEAARHIDTLQAPVLPTGPAGSGKTRMARAMHCGWLQADRPFRRLGLAGMPDDPAMIDPVGAKPGILPGGASRIGPMQKARRGPSRAGLRERRKRGSVVRPGHAPSDAEKEN